VLRHAAEVERAKWESVVAEKDAFIAQLLTRLNEGK
jgi:hypothetical protein